MSVNLEEILNDLQTSAKYLTRSADTEYWRRIYCVLLIANSIDFIVEDNKYLIGKSDIVDTYQKRFQTSVATYSDKTILLRISNFLKMTNVVLAVKHIFSPNQQQLNELCINTVDSSLNSGLHFIFMFKKSNLIK